jgi:general secretion pathway protein K
VKTLTVKALRPVFAFAAAKKVGAAPHRGEANRPIRMQGKANTTSEQPGARQIDQ